MQPYDRKVKSMTSTEMIAREVEQTEQKLVAVGKFGILMMVLALMAFAVLMYKVSTLVSPMTPGEQKLIFACLCLLLMAFFAGNKFARIADYRWAIAEWYKQSVKDYQDRHRGDKL
jgi:hypothetical protein